MANTKQNETAAGGMSRDHGGIARIFDRHKVRRNRARAATNFAAHDFLHRWSAENLSERRQDIKRTFPSVLQIGGRVPVALKTPDTEVRRHVVADLCAACLPAGGVACDEEFLPFAPRSFDLILSNLCLHSVNDLPGALIQINRTLSPDGVFLGAMLGGETLFELRAAMMQADMEVNAGAAARVAPFADKQQIGGLMQRARFALPVVDSEIITASYRDVPTLLRELRGMGESHSLAQRPAPMTRGFLGRLCDIYGEKFSEPDGRLRASFEIIFMIGWAPHESQQKPQRPGSARTRLADALGATEIKG